ncbi:MAG: phosphate ABC transporter substrate-binding protein PstS [Acetobacteraceae bacterium]|nr:phosphate ABC transporter substrate-binding protein PstS [Acetobacteraceae bacterium]MSP30924.1 phosphate ABC transporter substrate-binding protein PstS [Acetobacteraceae bacterium]
MHRRFLLLTTAAVLAAPALHGARAQSGASITGAGATFPNPLYQKWAEAAKAAGGPALNYQSVGSGAGQAQIRNRTVDFGASDAPMTGELLKENKLLQFPTTMGALVPIVNLPGVAIDQLKLTGDVLADIYLGNITKWNDARIAELNKGLDLPNLAIAPIYRADGSGTTYVWVSYLSAVSPEWKTKVGVGTSVKWPVGNGARGNEGVSATVRNTHGAIGYTENAYALQSKLTTTQLRNKAGQFVTPTPASFLAAAAGADWSVPNFVANVINTGGVTSWPIVAPTFILVPLNPADAARATNVFRFFDWAFTHGDAAAQQLEYIPLPDAVKQTVRAAWRRVQDTSGKPVWSS